MCIDVFVPSNFLAQIKTILSIRFHLQISLVFFVGLNLTLRAFLILEHGSKSIANKETFIYLFLHL